MRTTKFRGKRLQNGEWVFGSLIQVSQKECYIVVYNDDGYIRYEVDPETIGQFTGLLDKNEKEIYEDDIIHLGDPKITYVVLWIDCGLKAKQIGSYGSFCGVTYWADNMTIVGNIHDNPELLKNNFLKVKEKQNGSIKHLLVGH